MFVGKTYPSEALFGIRLWEWHYDNAYKTSGLYYKRITFVIDAPSVVSKWCSKLERHLLTIVIDDAS
jgi:hypothetical protein